MIWGKVIGALAGLALGKGPLGMVAGAIAGHWVDVILERHFPNKERIRRKRLFLTNVTCLSAKLAKVDGPVSREEVDSFKAQFRVADEDKSMVARLFDQAKQTSDGYAPYAQSLAENFSSEIFLLAEIFGALYRIAASDGGPNAAEQAFLQHVAQIFGVSYQPHFTYEWPRARPSQPDPYSVLGLQPNATNGDVKSAWRRLVQEHHPDKLIAKGVSEDYVAIATQKMAEINAAYDQICRDRGMS